jgi:hypothetical protein
MLGIDREDRRNRRSICGRVWDSEQLSRRSSRLLRRTARYTGSVAHIGNDKDFLSTRISYKLNLTGPASMCRPRALLRCRGAPCLPSYSCRRM